MNYYFKRWIALGVVLVLGGLAFLIGFFFLESANFTMVLLYWIAFWYIFGLADFFLIGRTLHLYS